MAASYTLPSNFMSVSYSDQSRVYAALPPTLHRIISATRARIYHAASGSSDWQSTGLKGIIVFGRDYCTTPSPNPYWFKLVDCRKGKAVWQHQLVEVSEYEAELPFFHVFTGKVRCSCEWRGVALANGMLLISQAHRFAFRFEEDEDAADFLKDVQERLVSMCTLSSLRTHFRGFLSNRAFILALQKPLPPNPSRSSSSSPKLTRRSPTLSGATISSPIPDSFQHVAHMSPSLDGNDKHDESWNIAPEWTQLLNKLGGYGVDAEMVEENFEFVKGFLAGAEAVRSSPPSSPASTPAASRSPSCTSDSEPEDYFHLRAPCEFLFLPCLCRSSRTNLLLAFL